MKRKVLFIFGTAAVLCVLLSFLPNKLQKEAQIHSWADGQYSLFNINNIAGFVYYDGLSGNDPYGDSGVLYPAGSAGVVFSEGVLWGGYVNDPDTNRVKLRIGGQIYNTGTRPGRIISPGIAQDPDDESVRVYRIRKDWQNLKPDDPQILAEIKQLREIKDSADSSVLAQDIIDQYKKDWQEWPTEYGAPFYDLNHNGIYEPNLGETPGLAGADQVLWFVVNDLKESTTLKFSGSPPTGLETQVTLWGYEQPNLPLGQATFRRYHLINKSAFQIDSMYLGILSDPDIGNYSNDFVGCDSVLELGYAYNSATTDILFDAFNLYPSAAGYQLLQGPIVSSPGNTALFNFKSKPGFKNLPLNAFSYYGTGSPIDDIDVRETAIKAYNMLRGYNNSSDMTTLKPYIHRSGPQKGEITKFPLSGDPLSGTGDLDGEGDNLGPTDVRIEMGSGPFTMMPGDTQEVVYALIGGLGNAYHPYCVEDLKMNARYIKNLYPNFEGLTEKFPAPKVSGMSSAGQITIEWGSDPLLTAEIEQDHAAGDYRFEGYNIYQLPSNKAADGQAVLIETIDTKAEPAGVFGYQRDPVTGIYNYKPLVNGTNSGIRHYTTMDRDYFSNQPFEAGRTYTFAVSAYRYQSNPGNPFPIIESKWTRINVLVHAYNPGYSAETGQEIDVQHFGHSTGYVKAFVANPGALTGHTYRINFDEQQRWSLSDLNTGEMKLQNQLNLSGDENYPVVDGVIPIVYGPAETGKINLFGYSLGTEGFDWGGQRFNGGVGLGENFFGSTLPTDSLVSVRIEFQDKYSAENFGFASRGAAYLNDAQRSYNGSGSLPLEAFEICSRDSLRRLNICFCENPETANRIWDMGWDGEAFPDTLGANEYLLIMKSDYDEGALYNNELNGTNADVLYALWLRQRGRYGFLEYYGENDILVELQNTPADYYLYTAPAPPHLPEQFNLLPAYPNPFNGNVRFRFRIPFQAKVKIDVYDINGRHTGLVFDATLEQGTHSIPWQPQGLASGMYFYKVSFGRKYKLGKVVYLK